MTDLHVHILPGVDDGSPNLSTSLEMAEMAAQSGVRILAVTPHANQTGIEGVEDGYVNYESEQLEEQFYRLEREINREHIPISLVRGMEIMSIGPLEKKIRERKLIPLHESRYYLIEVPLDMAPDGIRKQLLEFPGGGVQRAVMVVDKADGAGGDDLLQVQLYQLSAGQQGCCHGLWHKGQSQLAFDRGS